eukprot:5239595-Alexandrium_andersonii.AAC.1
MQQARQQCSRDWIVDYCAFGRPFRARARLRTAHFQCPALEGKQCRGRGRCQFSGRPHQQLSGA